jgi:hypothetical protein
MSELKKSKKSKAETKNELLTDLKKTETDATNNILHNTDNSINNIDTFDNSNNGTNIFKQINKSETETSETKGSDENIQDAKQTDILNEITPKKIETRGRKKGVSNKPKVDLTEYKKINISSENTPIQENKIDASKYLSGALLLLLIDAIIPSALCYLIPKGKKLKDINTLKMTKDEIKSLEELADECIKSLNLQMSPLEAFLFGLTFTYGTKFLSLTDADYITDIKQIKVVKK